MIVGWIVEYIICIYDDNAMSYTCNCANIFLHYYNSADSVHRRLTQYRIKIHSWFHCNYVTLVDHTLHTSAVRMYWLSNNYHTPSIMWHRGVHLSLLIFSLLMLLSFNQQCLVWLLSFHVLDDDAFAWSHDFFYKPAVTAPPLLINIESRRQSQLWVCVFF